MVAPLNTRTTIEQRGLVRFLWAKDMATKDIHNEVLPMYGKHCLSRQAVRNWVQKFSEGRTSIEDEDLVGRPVEIATPANVAARRRHHSSRREGHHRRCSHRYWLFTSFAAIHFAHKKPHNATLFYRGTRIQGRRHLVTGAPFLQSCAYQSLHVTIKLDSAAD